MADRPAPLVVIPLPARLPVVIAVLGALATTWETEYGKTLTTARMSQESTPWGPAMVVREPEETHPDEPMSEAERSATSCVECMDRPAAHGSDFCPACQEAHLA